MRKLFEWLFSKKKEDAPARDVATLVSEMTAPALHVITTEAPSRSHFGGSPRLPPQTHWPERAGKKLTFLARLSLEEIRDVLPIDWLPGSGALLFFYDTDEQPWGFDPADHGGWAVLHVPDLDKPVQRPDKLGDGDVAALLQKNVDFRRIDVYPSYEREAVRALALSDREGEDYFEIQDAVFQGKPKHQVSGFPAPVQGDGMELECQLASNGLYCGNASGYEDPRAKLLGPGAAQWKLLFQFDTDDDLDVMWGDAGTIYYWIREEEAKSSDFAKTWLVLQCG